MSVTETPSPRIVAWHLWSILAIMLFRAERALRIGRLIGRLKWTCLARADAAFPPEDRGT
jgi:hypothetical protein